MLKLNTVLARLTNSKQHPKQIKAQLKHVRSNHSKISSPRQVRNGGRSPSCVFNARNFKSDQLAGNVPKIHKIGWGWSRKDVKLWLPIANFMNQGSNTWIYMITVVPEYIFLNRSLQIVRSASAGMCVIPGTVLRLAFIHSGWSLHLALSTPHDHNSHLITTLQMRSLTPKVKITSSSLWLLIHVAHLQMLTWTL